MRSRRQTILTVLRVSSGNFLEMYDFIIYAYYAHAIAAAFFPAGSAFVSLMLALVTFGAGFLMRPVGAAVLGAYMDRRGRRAGLMLSLALMAVGTLSIALTPGYRSIGLAAPLIVVAGRLLQGFSAGVELGGVSVYLAEIAPPGRRGVFCAWQSASQQVAVVFSALLGVALASASAMLERDGVVAPDFMDRIGWRIPLGIGCLLVPLLLLLRRSLTETAAFTAGAKATDLATTLRALAASWRLVLRGAMHVALTTTAFYLITSYTPTFGRDALHLAPTSALLVTLYVGLSNLVWLPLGGALSDRVGRRPVLIWLPILVLLSATPALAWLVAAPGFLRLLLVELWLSALYGLYNGAMIPHLVEIMPPALRTTGFSLAYSLATAVFGGFTPAVCTWLIYATGSRAMPGVWLSVAAALSLAATVKQGSGSFLKKRTKKLSSV